MSTLFTAVKGRRSSVVSHLEPDRKVIIISYWQVFFSLGEVTRQRFGVSDLARKKHSSRAHLPKVVRISHEKWDFNDATLTAAFFVVKVIIWRSQILSFAKLFDDDSDENFRKNWQHCFELTFERSAICHCSSINQNSVASVTTSTRG